MIKEESVRVKQYNLCNLNHEVEYNKALNDKFIKVKTIKAEFDKAGRYQIVCELTGPDKHLKENYNE